MWKDSVKEIRQDLVHGCFSTVMFLINGQWCLLLSHWSVAFLCWSKTVCCHVSDAAASLSSFPSLVACVLLACYWSVANSSLAFLENNLRHCSWSVAGVHGTLLVLWFAGILDSVICVLLNQLIVGMAYDWSLACGLPVFLMQWFAALLLTSRCCQRHVIDQLPVVCWHFQ